MQGCNLKWYRTAPLMRSGGRSRGSSPALHGRSWWSAHAILRVRGGEGELLHRITSQWASHRFVGVVLEEHPPGQSTRRVQGALRRILRRCRRTGRSTKESAVADRLEKFAQLLEAERLPGCQRCFLNLPAPLPAPGG